MKSAKNLKTLGTAKSAGKAIKNANRTTQHTMALKRGKGARAAKPN